MLKEENDAVMKTCCCHLRDVNQQINYYLTSFAEIIVFTQGSRNSNKFGHVFGPGLI